MQLPNIIARLGPDGSFNTVNGKYYCNFLVSLTDTWFILAGFNTVNGKYYCNLGMASELINSTGFNTVNGKYYCNPTSTWICSSKQSVSIP